MPKDPFPGQLGQLLSDCAIFITGLARLLAFGEVNFGTAF